MDHNKVVEILRVEGIMAQGYGLNPKLVMRDRRLTPESKCIYAYFSSFAGAGNQAFPSRDLMLDELGMSVNRYYKHLKLLLNCDYIRIDKRRTDGHLFTQNIYTLVALPNPEIISECIVEETQQHDFPPAGKPQTAGKQAKPKKLQVKQRLSLNALREQLGIETLKLQMPEQADLIEDVFMATEDIASSEQINVGGSVKKKEAIEELISKLKADNVRFVVHNMMNNKAQIKNKKAYLQVCICNSIFDMKEINKDTESIKSEKKQEEEKRLLAAEDRKKMQREQYQNYPLLKEIDDELLKIQSELAKAVLSGNEISATKIKNKRDAAMCQRNEILEKYDIQDCQ